MQAVTTCANYVILNVLCLLCSMPVITLGAAQTAKYYVSMKLARGEDPYVIKDFFKSFLSNLKQATFVWSILAAICAFLAYDWYVIFKGGMQAPTFYKVLLGIASFVAGGVFFTVFPLLARFYMSTKELIRGAAIFALGHLLRVAIGLFVMVIPYVIGAWYLREALGIWFFITGFALYYNSRFFVKEFDKVTAAQGLDTASSTDEADASAEDDSDVERIFSDEPIELPPEFFENKK